LKVIIDRQTMDTYTTQYSFTIHRVGQNKTPHKQITFINHTVSRHIFCITVNSS